MHSPLAFVCGHRKSGTTLLASLLDGHAQLAVYPYDLTLLYAYFPDFVRAHQDPGERRARLRQVLFSSLAERLAATATSARFDLDEMQRQFFEGLRDDDLADMRTLISRLNSACQAVSGKDLQSTRHGIIKETSIEIYATEMFRWFPDARFVHLLRDPRDNFAALCAGVDKYYSRFGEDHNRTLASLLNRARTGFRMGLHNRATFGPARYHIMRFEDLTSVPEQTMRELAQFLGIDFDVALMTPTNLGAPTKGNNFDGEAMFAINSRNVGRWRERITAEDAAVIEFHLGDEMTAFGYKLECSPAERARAAAEFYKWQNYAYFYSDRFSLPGQT